MDDYQKLPDKDKFQPIAGRSRNPLNQINPRFVLVALTMLTPYVVVPGGFWSAVIGATIGLLLLAWFTWLTLVETYG